MDPVTKNTEVVVIGAGPGGYTAAFRAADLGKKVILINNYENIGGVCLNVGCIPSKALLHVAEVLVEAQEASHFGVEFTKPKIDIAKIRSWKEQIINQLASGLKGLAKQRKVEVITGVASFSGANTLTVNCGAEQINIGFQHAIIAVGSQVAKLPIFPDDPRIIDSTGALALTDIPEKLLVVGGGIIGLEMATVYSALGSQVSIAELTPQLFPGVDKDLVTTFTKKANKDFAAIMVDTKVTKVHAKKDGLWVNFVGNNAPAQAERFDKVLVAVGRVPNGKMINANKAGVYVDERGFIPVDKQLRTNVGHIFAIGDVVGQPMLAHKAIPEGKIAAEVICGKKHYFEPRCIPSVAYTRPEVAWVGVTEQQAREKKIAYEKGIFPWAASGRALAMGCNTGITKVIAEQATNKVIGVGIVGPRAGDLITEAALAIEMGCDVEDLALTIHPHPTLSETIAQAAEALEGTITDLYLPKKEVKQTEK